MISITIATRSRNRRAFAHGLLPISITPLYREVTDRRMQQRPPHEWGVSIISYAANFVYLRRPEGRLFVVMKSIPFGLL